MYKRFQVIVAAATVALTVIFTGPVAQAHPGTDWIPKRWDSAALLDGSAGVWLYAGTNVGPNASDRINDAKNSWNNAPPAIRYEWKGNQDWTTGCGNLPRNRNLVAYHHLDDPIIVRTTRCYTSDGLDMDKFWVSVEPDACWYHGTGTPSSNCYDYWAVLTNHLAFGLGWGSGAYSWFGDPPNDLTCNDPATPSMCNSILDTGSGDLWVRSLATHDTHTLDSRYP